MYPPRIHLSTSPTHESAQYLKHNESCRHKPLRLWFRCYGVHNCADYQEMVGSKSIVGVSVFASTRQVLYPKLEGGYRLFVHKRQAVICWG